MPSKRLHSFLLGGVCVCCCAAALVSVRVRGGLGGGPHPVEPSAVVSEVAELREEVAQLRQLSASQSREQMDSLALAMRRAPTVVDVARPGGARQPQHEPMTIDKAEELARKSRQIQEERFRVLEEKIRAEQRDDAWALPIEDTLRRAMAQPDLAGYTLNNVQCGKTLCRLEVSETSVATPGAGLMALAPAVPELPSALYLTNKDEHGRAITIAFFARPGFGFPPPPNDQNPDLNAH